MRRLHITNKAKTHFVEFIDDEKGMQQAKELRKHNPNYKGQRIKNVIQLYYSDVLPEIEYEYE